MIAQLACLLALSGLQQDSQTVNRVDLSVTPGSVARLWIQYTPDPLAEPHKSPKKFGENKMQWDFPWIVGGFSHITGDDSNVELRFQVYSQEQKSNRAVAVTQMLLRLWEFNTERLSLKHPTNYHLGIVDVYLCFGGQAGGEQLIDQEESRDRVNPNKTNIYKVNTIYIYDTNSFTDPVEMAREVAHEYGHASWPPIGGFKDPEEWADGYLAEKVFLRWIRDAMARNELTPDDAMGATKAALDKWIAANVDPLILKAAQTEPTSDLLADPSKNGMDAFIGLALYLETIYPDKVFARTLMLGTYDAKNYPAGVVLAAEEPDQVTLKIPTTFIRKAIWIPLGTGKLTGAAILKKDPTGWVQIQVGANPIVITNTH